jgi:hypothetical protein
LGGGTKLLILTGRAEGFLGIADLAAFLFVTKSIVLTFIGDIFASGGETNTKVGGARVVEGNTFFRGIAGLLLLESAKFAAAAFLSLVSAKHLGDTREVVVIAKLAFTGGIGGGGEAKADGILRKGGGDVLADAFCATGHLLEGITGFAAEISSAGGKADHLIGTTCAGDIETDLIFLGELAFSCFTKASIGAVAIVEAGR